MIMINSLTNGAVSTMRLVALSALLALVSQGLMASRILKVSILNRPMKVGVHFPMVALISCLVT